MTAAAGRPESTAKRGSAGGRGRFERFLFSFMGPPQLGDVNAPSSYVPDPAAALCRKCDQPWDDHEVVRTGQRTYARCPEQPAS